MQKINKRVTSQQYMVLNVLAFAEENGQAFENDALFQKHLQTLKTNADALLALEEKILRYRMPLGEQKQKLLEDYLSSVGVLIDALNEVAAIASNEDLLQFLSNCKSALRNSSQFNRLGLSRNLFDYVNIFRTELETLNKGKEIVASAENRHQAYKDFVLLPSQKRKKAATFYSDYLKLLHATNAYVRSHIRPFFNRAFIDQPGLMELFDRYMEIPKTAKRTSNAEATAMPVDDNANPAATVAPETTASTGSTTNPSNNENNAVAPNDAVASSDSAPVAEVTNASSAEVS